MTGEDLVTEMTTLGVPWKRTTLVHFETGKRESIDVEELHVLSFIFQVPINELVDLDSCRNCRRQPPKGFTCNSCRTRG